MKVVLAEMILDGKRYIVCETTTLENLEKVILKSIQNDLDVKLVMIDEGTIVNPNSNFVSDFKKIARKKNSGDESVYFRGDYGKYYITDYHKIVNMYEMLKAKAEKRDIA